MCAAPNNITEQLRSRLEKHHQSHLLRFWDQLAPDDRQSLLNDLDLVDLDSLPDLVDVVRGAVDAGDDQKCELAPPEVVDPAPRAAEATDRGLALLSDGKVAALTVAGGQGTRLGFEGPKGAFPISPIRGKSLFQLFAETILAIGRRVGRSVPWYVMTGRSNDEDTRRFFVQHAYFGLAPSDVTFFRQGVMPAFDTNGNMLLEQRHRLALSPDGHGGCLLAMAREGVLADMRNRGIEHISYFQVDNPLVHCIDPVFIGIHDLLASDMSSKTVPKADDFERVGNFVLRNGRLSVVEYSNLPDSLARARNPDGARRFDAGNIAIHLLTRAFVERLTTGTSGFRLPWHRADKAVPHVDLDTGAVVEPTEPNAVKLESFVFDALPLADRPILVATDRQEEFSPVKNPEGVDSIDTARRDMVRRAKRWLAAAGVDVPGDAGRLVEISPVYAPTREALAQRSTPTPPEQDESPWYIE